MSTRGIRKERRDDYVINTKQMLNMDSATFNECEHICEEANDYANDNHWKLENRLKEQLTGEYFDTLTGMRFQYMKYNIPSKASRELKTFMRNLKSEYEALDLERRQRAGMRHH